jgi:phosphoglucomutase
VENILCWLSHETLLLERTVPFAAERVHPPFGEVVVGKSTGATRAQAIRTVFPIAAPVGLRRLLPIRGGLTWKPGVTRLLLTYASGCPLGPA